MGIKVVIDESERAKILINFVSHNDYLSHPQLEYRWRYDEKIGI